jgi:hypothetical protein
MSSYGIGLQAALRRVPMLVSVWDPSSWIFSAIMIYVRKSGSVNLLPLQTNYRRKLKVKAAHCYSIKFGCQYKCNFFLIRVVGVWVQTASTWHVGHFWPIVPAPVDCEDGEFVGMKIGRGNRSTRRKSTPAQLSPPQIPLDQTRARTRVAAAGSQPLNHLSCGDQYKCSCCF